MEGFNYGGDKRNEKRKKELNRTAALSLTALFVLLSFAITVGVGLLPVSAQTANSGTSYAVMEASCGKILYGANADKRMEPASTTKIMTALIAAERCDLDKSVEITAESAGVEGSSIYLKKGEVWTVRDLLYGLMLRSGNDAATALAIECGGSIKGFVEMMNAKVSELGLTGTHFDNPHGLHSENHYTTAADLGRIACAAMANRRFKEVVSTKIYTVAENATHEKHFFGNKNKMLSMYDGANGIKTGYTTDAGKCLVSAARRGGMQLVCVTLNNPDMWNYSMKALDAAFADYKPITLAKADCRLFSVPYGKKQLSLALSEDMVYPVKEGDDLRFGFSLNCDATLALPIKSGQTVGRINVYDGERLLFGKEIVTMNDINDKGELLLLSGLVGDWRVKYNDGEIKQVFGFGGRGIASGGR